MSNDLDTTDLQTLDLQKRLRPSLLLCRVVTAFVFIAWGYGTIVRPQINADQLAFLYYIKLPSSVMMALGALQIAIGLAVLIGFQKKYTRAALLILAVLACFMPKILQGYITATIGGVPHPVVLYYAMLCLLGTAAMTYIMRDEDTLWSIG